MAWHQAPLVRSIRRRLGLAPAKPIVVQLGRDGRELAHPRLLQHFPDQQPLPGQSRWTWPAHIDPDRRPWLRTLRRLYDQTISFPYSLSPEAGLLLHAVVLNARPTSLVEIGSNIGISTLWIAGAMAESAGRDDEPPSPPPTLTCFDDFAPIRLGEAPVPDQPADREGFLRAALAEAGVTGMVTVVPGRSARTLPRRAPARVQFAFIDGDHSPAGVLADFLAVEPHLDTGGLIALHDTFPWMCGWTGPRRLLNTLHQHAKGTYQQIDLYLAPVNYGLALLRRIG